MGYVVAAILVLLLVAGFVTFLVMNSMRKGAGRASADASAAQSDRGGPPGIGEDPTPLGDTAELAGVDPGDAGESERGSRPEERQRGNAGAEGGPTPESERLADRPR